MSVRNRLHEMLFNDIQFRRIDTAKYSIRKTLDPSLFGTVERILGRPSSTISSVLDHAVSFKIGDFYGNRRWDHIFMCGYIPEDIRVSVLRSLC